MSKRIATKIKVEARLSHATRNRHEVWHSPDGERVEPLGEWNYISARAAYEAVNKYPPMEQ